MEILENIRCVKCYTELGESQDVLLCNGCNLWQHRKCSDVRENFYKQFYILTMLKRDISPWRCHYCIKFTTQVTGKPPIPLRQTTHAAVKGSDDTLLVPPNPIPSVYDDTDDDLNAMDIARNERDGPAIHRPDTPNTMSPGSISDIDTLKTLSPRSVSSLNSNPLVIDTDYCSSPPQPSPPETSTTTSDTATPVVTTTSHPNTSAPIITSSVANAVIHPGLTTTTASFTPTLTTSRASDDEIQTLVKQTTNIHENIDTPTAKTSTHNLDSDSDTCSDICAALQSAKRSIYSFSESDSETNTCNEAKRFKFTHSSSNVNHTGSKTKKHVRTRRKRAIKKPNQSETTTTKQPSRRKRSMKVNKPTSTPACIPVYQPICENITSASADEKSPVFQSYAAAPSITPVRPMCSQGTPGYCSDTTDGDDESSLPAFTMNNIQLHNMTYTPVSESKTSFPDVSFSNASDQSSSLTDLCGLLGNQNDISSDTLIHDYTIPALHSSDSSDSDDSDSMVTYTRSETTISGERSTLTDSYGYTYHVKFTYGSRVVWCCTSKLTGCPASVVQTHGDRYIRGFLEHNHPVRPITIQFPTLTPPIQTKDSAFQTVNNCQSPMKSPPTLLDCTMTFDSSCLSPPNSPPTLDHTFTNDEEQPKTPANLDSTMTFTPPDRSSNSARQPTNTSLRPPRRASTLQSNPPRQHKKAHNKIINQPNETANQVVSGGNASYQEINASTNHYKKMKTVLVTSDGFLFEQKKTSTSLIIWRCHEKNANNKPCAAEIHFHHEQLETSDHLTGNQIWAINYKGEPYYHASHNHPATHSAVALAKFKMLVRWCIFKDGRHNATPNSLISAALNEMFLGNNNDRPYLTPLEQRHLPKTESLKQFIARQKKLYKEHEQKQ